jgi:hypothetical protein
MCPDALYFIILLCLTPDDFTRQGESAATQWVNMSFGSSWCRIVCKLFLIVHAVVKVYGGGWHQREKDWVNIILSE